MKIVQTLWSLPSTMAGEQKIKQGRFKGGWLAHRYYLMSMCLSCLSLKRFYPNIVLITDATGHNLLIKKFCLPYSDVKVQLDQFNDRPTGLWALPKIYSYSIQNEPFLHVDNDVFIWGKFPVNHTNAGLFVQNFEPFTFDYVKALVFIKNNFTYIPDIYRKFLKDDIENFIFKNDNYQAINAGVFGGNDIEFIQYYTKNVFNIVDKNIKVLMKNENSTGILNLVLEQLSFYQLAIKNKKKITCLLDNFSFASASFQTLIKLEYAPFHLKYNHCLGETKLAEFICKQVEYRLRFEFPEYYNKVIDYLLSEGIENESSFINNLDYTRFSENYAYLRHFKNLNCLLETPMQMREHLQIKIENNELFLHEPGKENLKLEGWAKFLFYYSKNPITGLNIMELMLNSEVGKSFTKFEIEDGLLSLVAQFLVCQNYLKIIK